MASGQEAAGMNLETLDTVMSVVVGLDIGPYISNWIIPCLDTHVPAAFPSSWEAWCIENFTPNSNASNYPLEWLKFALLRNDDLPHKVSSSRKFIMMKAALEAESISAEKAIADYLRHLWDCYVGKSSKSHRFGVPHRVSSEIFMTFPASCPLHARLLILQAFREAGILSDDVNVSSRSIPSLEATVVVRVAALSRLAVDGTSIVYTAHGAGVQGFFMEELIPQASIFAGAGFLDDGLMELLKAKLKKMLPLYIFETLTEEVFQNFSHNYLEGCAKIDYPWIEPDTRYLFTIPSAGGSYSRHDISFNVDELASIFDPIVDKIVTLVRSQSESVDLVPGKSMAALGGMTVLRLDSKQPYRDSHHLQPLTAYRKNMEFSQTNRTLTSISLAFSFSQLFVLASLAPATAYSQSLKAQLFGSRGLPPQAISVLHTNIGQVNTVNVHRKMGEDLQEQLMCAMKWPIASIESQFEMMTLGSGSGVELDFAWDGVKMDVSVFVNGVRPEGLEIGQNASI
ncbi:unnamed protein product [Fusarium equiseti]|uniref:Uncharacterized protein n=1 Tax=Fusarium equiseti TaxID=61235 RepID=A0A8J2IT64_FUSEQ|nr:unnamed protein product [Fusarium equiseti]